MAASQFASLDGTAGYDTETIYYPPASNPMARRSVSIFSRRGTETPELMPSFIAQAAITTPEPMPSTIAHAAATAPKSDTNDKQKSWMSRRKSLRSLSSTKASILQKPKGTVLNAVPPAKFIQMTALEEEMACSPNDEILSAVSEHPPAQVWAAQPKLTTLTQQGNIWDRRGTSLLHRAKSGKSKDTQSRIGLWVNGVTEWDEEVRQYRAVVDQSNIRQVIGSAVVSPISADASNGLYEKSSLSVSIPRSERRSQDTALPAPGSPRLRRCVVSVAPASIVSKFNNTPAITIEEAAVVSPLETVAHDHALESLGSEESESQDRRSGSRSSSYYSSTADNDSASICSKHSSATSIEGAPSPPLTKRSSKRLSRKPVSATSSADIAPKLNSEEDLAASSESTAIHIALCGPDQCTCVKRIDSVRSVMQPPECAPTVPRRSRKRDWRASAAVRQNVQIAMPTTLARRKSDTELKLPADTVVSGMSLLPSNVRRSSSVAQAQAAQAHSFVQWLPIPDEKIAITSNADAPLILPRIAFDDGLIVVRGPVVLGADGKEVPAAQVAAASAEDVVLAILSALTSLDDLSSTAMLNKGMYRVYKENEMQLIRAVAFNASPAAWEFREWSPPERNKTASSKASSQLEHTPKSYMRCYKRDVTVVESLKTLILKQCQTFIRHETASALSSPAHRKAQRFDDAFWRIWCFCKIFGCGKNREDDVTGQLDWLKGGLLANQGCGATVNTSLDFDMSSVLLNAPEHFAKGNGQGLTAQQLYDMTEIWTCLAAILRGYHDRVDQAREAGIFHGCDIVEGNVEREAQLLEEWTSHVLTLGPAVVLEMAEYATDSSSAGFSLAKVNGWTTWTPPQYGGSRGTFLKEPVARLYEERIAAAAHMLQNPRTQAKKDKSRKRVATLAAEIKVRRQSSAHQRSPYIDMTMERPMSMLSHKSTVSSRASHQFDSPQSSRCQTPTGSSPEGMSSTLWSARKISPIIEHRVETFNRMSLQNFAAGVAEDTAALAVKKIVDMGFTEKQAREALKMTDMGDGLRVDRAVDLLLRR